MNEHQYETVEARGEIRVLPRPEFGVVGVNVFGTYAQLNATEARALANHLLDAAATVATPYPHTTGGYL